MSFYAEATGAATTPQSLGALSSRDLGREFDRYFAIARATADADRETAFAIRHAVYCEELGYEPVRADRREHDDCDAVAEHLLLGSVEQQRAIACARVVPAGLGPLPLEIACAGALGARWSNLKLAHRVGELSRLAVVREFRRRKGEDARDVAISEADFATSGRPRFPFVPVGLCLGAIVLAKRGGLDALAVLAEPQLATHLGRLGLALQQIGSPVQHHGTRVPYVLDVTAVVAGMRPWMRPLYQTIERDLDDVAA